MIDISAYLQRIGFDGPLHADLETLRALHRAHVLAISYENFDVQLKRPITIDPQAAFEKLVHRRRGGWCYEMNGVFGLVLQAIGFEITRLAADGSTPASHLVLTVAMEGATYIADVGFSDGPVEPYPLVEGSFAQEGFDFRIELQSGKRWRMHNHRFGAAPGFSAGVPDEPAMANRCQWLQTSPDSPFVQHSTVFRRMNSGYVSLIDLTLRTVMPEGVTRVEITTVDEYLTALKTHFALDLPEIAVLWPAMRTRHETYMRESAARRTARTDRRADNAKAITQ
jgi:N-hydroxyarylamine O-acetyltransferase